MDNNVDKLNKDLDKKREKFRILVPVGKKEIYVKEPTGKILWFKGKGGEVIDTSLIRIAPGRGFYRNIEPHTMDFKEQKIQAEGTNRDIYVDVSITWRIAGGLNPESDDAQLFYEKEAPDRVINSRNSETRRKFWSKYHPILTYYSNEEAIKNEYNSVVDGRDHKSGILETIVNETLRKYLTNLPYKIIENVNNPLRLKDVMAELGIDPEANKKQYNYFVGKFNSETKKYEGGVGDRIKEEIAEKFWELGLQIDTFAYKGFHGDKEFEAKQEEIANLDLQQQIIEKENRNKILSAKGNQEAEKINIATEALRVKTIGEANNAVAREAAQIEVEKVQGRADAVRNLGDAQATSAAGVTTELKQNNFNIAEPILGVATGIGTSLVGGTTSVADRVIVDDIKKHVASKSGKVTSYKEVEDEDVDIFEEKKDEDVNTTTVEPTSQVETVEFFTDNEDEQPTVTTVEANAAEVSVNPVSTSLAPVNDKEYNYTFVGDADITEINDEQETNDDEKVNDDDTPKVKKI